MVSPGIGGIRAIKSICNHREDPTSLDELKAEAMKLMPEGRAQPAHALFLSLDELSGAEIEKLWLEEAIRRDEEIDSGMRKKSFGTVTTTCMCHIFPAQLANLFLKGDHHLKEWVYPHI